MKKILKDELLGLAHRILQLKGREDIDELKDKAAELHEKLSVLSFAEQHFSDQPDRKKTIEQSLQKDLKVPKTKSSADKEKPQDLQTTVAKKPLAPQAEKPQDTQKPQTDEEFTAEKYPLTAKKEAENQPQQQNQDLEQEEESLIKREQRPENHLNIRNIAVHYDDLPQFTPAEPKQPEQPMRKQVDDASSEEEKVKSSPAQPQTGKTPKKPPHIPDLFSPPKRRTKNNPDLHKRSLNDRLNNGLKFGLNDRISFVKHLFEENITDYNRVLSQLNTFQTYSEAKQFIEHQVKPEYDWSEKSEYEERFLNAIENKLQD